MWRSIAGGGVLVSTWVLAFAAAAPQSEPASPAAAQHGTTETKPGTAETKPATRLPAKPLSPHVLRGAKWLVDHQLNDGAWGQGEESVQMRGHAELKDAPSLADTCVATLALIRAGHTPARGEYASQVRRAVEFVCSQVEQADQDSLFITPSRGTRVQSKLGPYIDTFLAAVLLPEARHQMPDDAGRRRVSAALDKVLVKIQKNQRADGTWGGQGWATTLQQGLAVKGLNRAAQFGATVDEQVRARAEDQARQSFDRASGKFKEEGSAGVQLYAAGSGLGSVAESVKTNAQRKGDLDGQLASPTTSPAAKAAARATLDRYKAAEQDLRQAQNAVIARLDDQQFVAGFGSNGGEEFLSYLNIGESLVSTGGEAWKSWDKSISENLNRVQNSDGSWSGHHCITGRTFCTAAALLVLMVDRSPQPLAEKMKQR